MLKIIIIVFVIGVNLKAIVSDECGLSLNLNYGNRIVGGRQAVKGEFPWIVSIQKKVMFSDEYYNLCGGTILSPKWILTAAHCLHGLDISSIRVIAGAHDIHIWTEGMSIHSAHKLVIHSGFKYNSQPPIHDIALIQLNEKIDFEGSEWLSSSVCLPQRDYIIKGLVTAAGWGTTYAHSVSPVLMAIDLPFVDKDSCRKKWGFSMIKSDMNVFCAGAQSGKDTCEGDSGGPVIQMVDKRAVIVGITSFGHQYCGTEGWPAVYTQVDKYLDWIYGWIDSENYLN